jgi:hypothetical protein
MNHQPFESWLLSEEVLEQDQELALREHLRNCEHCAELEASWGAVHKMFEASPRVRPAAGFTDRWESRLAMEKKKRHNRQSGFFLAITAGIATVLLLVMGIHAVDLLRFPEQLILFLIYRIATLIGYAYTTQNLVFSLAGTLVDMVPGPAWIAFVGLITMVFVLWFVVFKQLMYSRRISL